MQKALFMGAGIRGSDDGVTGLLKAAAVLGRAMAPGWGGIGLGWDGRGAGVNGM